MIRSISFKARARAFCSCSFVVLPKLTRVTLGWSTAYRTSPPEGFHSLDHAHRRGNPNPRGRMDKENPGLGKGEQ